ncbi:unnamed protein product [Ectocarpus sp. 4 AP-2014]
MPHPPRRRRRMPEHQDSTITPTSAAEEEAREPGALAPRQLPGNEESKNAGEATGCAAAVFAAPSSSSSSSHRPEEDNHHQEALEGEEARDFGYGNSFGAGIPLPSSPGGGVSEMMATGRFLAGQPRKRFGAEKSRPGGGGRDSSAAAAAAAGTRGSPFEGRYQQRHHDDDMKMSDSSARVAAAEEEATAGAEEAAPAGPRAAPREQVSLPDDIYGAARVSEYWHGVPALSSLASTYVYDDIWAGDGGLNSRENLMSMIGWTAEGGVGTSHDRGGDAIVQALRAVAYTEPPDQWPGGNERKGMEGTKVGQGRRRWEGGASGRNNGGGGGGARFGGERQWVRRVNEKPAAGECRGEDAHVCSDDRVCGRGHDGLKWRRKGRGNGGGGGGGGGWGEGSREGTMSGGERSDGCSADEEVHASKKRRTPSPDPARKSSPAAEDAAHSAMGSSSAGAASARPGAADQLTMVEEKTVTKDRALREAEVIRWCQRVSSPRAVSDDGGSAAGVGGISRSAAGPDENFFAGRVLDPVPARHWPGTARTTTGGSEVSDAVVGWGAAVTAASSSPQPLRPPSLGFGVANLSGGGRGDDNHRSGSGSSGGTDATSGFDQCPSSRDEEAMARVPRAASPSAAKCSSRSPLASGFAGAAFASVATAGSAGEATTPAATGSRRSPPSAQEQEGFFDSHTLEPKPRRSWILDAGEEESAGGETRGTGASGTAVPKPAHGIPMPPDSQRSDHDASGPAWSASERREGHNPLCWSDTAGRYPPLFEEGAAGAAVADTESSGSTNDWQVRPEAMAGFFTTVGSSAYSPAALLHSQRRPSPPRVRSPPAIGPAAPAGVGIQPSPTAIGAAAAGRVAKPTADAERMQQVLGYRPVWGSGGGGGGGGADGTPPAAGAAAAAAAVTREGTVPAVSQLNSGCARDRSSVSSGWDVGSAGAGAARDDSGKEEEGDNSWGW